MSNGFDDLLLIAFDSYPRVFPEVGSFSLDLLMLWFNFSSEVLLIAKVFCTCFVGMKNLGSLLEFWSGCLGKRNGELPFLGSFFVLTGSSFRSRLYLLEVCRKSF